MENGAFALLEQRLHFPLYFQIRDISKAFMWSKGLTYIGLESFLWDIGKQCRMRHLIRVSTFDLQNFQLKFE